MSQFLVSPKDIRENVFTIRDKDEVKHLSCVMRIGVGEKIFLFDNTGNRYVGKISEIQKNFVSGKIIHKLQEPEKRVYIRIFPAMLKLKRFEFLLEKVTELGVDEIFPCVSSRSSVRIPSERVTSKLSRWNKVLLSSAKQCNRLKIPELSDNILEFETAVKSVKSDELNLIAWEYEEKNLLRDILFGHQFLKYPVLCNLFIGPEGGFTEKEINFAARYGFKTFSLGKNIMRAETAAIVSCGLISSI